MRDGAAILVIGNEILSGKVQDTNSPFLVRELRELGFAVLRIEVVPDVVGEIAEAVARLARGHAQVFTSGGVGPTLDDLTFEGVARAFGLELREDEGLARIIRGHFGARTTPSHLKMAVVPAGARLTWGEGLKWPVVEVGNVMVLPGDPTILQKKFHAVRERFRRDPWHLRRVFTSLEEGELAPALDVLQGRHPDLSIGSYPVYQGRDYAVQVTLEAKERDVVERALADFRGMMDPRAIVRVE